MAAARNRVDLNELESAFAARFGARPRFFRAPGRINIIGEHTDYSEGFVMPAAIGRHCVVAAAANGRDELRVVSCNLGQEAVLPRQNFARAGAWSDYVAGAFFALKSAGFDPPGCDLAIQSDVPMGAGVSSSAALEVAAAQALLAMAGAKAAPDDLARWAREAETRFVGMPCGPMDQFVSVRGRAGHALKLDCRTLTADYAPIPAAAAFVLIDSGVRHQLVDGGYEARRNDCAEAARLLGVPALRDASLEIIDALPARLQRRARHVVTENARVGQAAAALSANDLARLGALMAASHASLRDDFDVTCAETDLLARIAGETGGVYGARQMGGGFGGAVLALVDGAHAEQAMAAILAAYRAQTKIESSAFVCQIADGASEIAR